MEVQTPSIVLKMRTSLWARDTRLLADGIVHTMRREHFTIYINLGEVNFNIHHGHRKKVLATFNSYTMCTHGSPDI